MKLKADTPGRRWLGLAAALAFVMAAGAAVAPLLFGPGRAAPKAQRIMNYFGPVTIVKGQSLRLDAAYVACAAKDCPEEVEVTLATTTATETYQPNFTPTKTVTLARDGVATHTLRWDDVPGDGDGGRKTVFGVIQVASTDGRKVSTTGVSAVAHLVDSKTGSVDLALPRSQRLCGEEK